MIFIEQNFFIQFIFFLVKVKYYISKFKKLNTPFKDINKSFFIFEAIQLKSSYNSYSVIKHKKSINNC